jgi:hypothetical protein
MGLYVCWERLQYDLKMTRRSRRETDKDADLEARLGLAGMLRSGHSGSVESQRLFQTKTILHIPAQIELRRGADIDERLPPEDAPSADELCVYHARGEYQQREPNPNLLLKFAGLADASDEQIFDFARHWGLLGLCVHGIPGGHRIAGGTLTPQGGRTTEDICMPVPWEPVRIWQS